MSRASLTQLLVSAVIVALIALLCVGISYYIVTRIHYYRVAAEAAARGRIVPKQEWPQTLIDLLKDAEQHHIKVGDIHVYQMSHDEYYWKFDSSPELFSLMSKRWELYIVKSYDIIQRFQERMPTTLVWLSHSDGTAYYISANWLAGEKGDLYCVMNNKAKQVLVVRYYYNF